jgi:hypothetical protein
MAGPSAAGQDRQISAVSEVNSTAISEESGRDLQVDRSHRPDFNDDVLYGKP